MNTRIREILMPEITPFWQCIPRFFRYPFHVQPLLYMLLLSVATLLGFILPVPTMLGMLIAHAGAWLAFLRYAYKTLDQTAHGLLTPDQHEPHEDPERAALPYKQLLIFIIMGIIIGIAEWLGTIALGITLIFMTFAIPASVMILAVSKSFWSGLNPLALMSLMRMVGVPYLGLWAMLMMLIASQEGVAVFVLPKLPIWLGIPALNFIGMFFTLVMFYLMGYVMHQYHGILGVDQYDRSWQDSGQNSGQDKARSSDEIGRLVAEGQIEQALEIAYEAQRTAPDSPAEQQRYHKLLTLAGHNERLLAHAPRYLSLLLKKNMDAEALDLYARMQAINATFTPEHPQHLLALAEAARRARNYPLALTLVKGYDKRFPNNAAIPDVYLFAAKVLYENLRKEAQARPIFEALCQRFAQHPASIEAAQYLEVIKRTAA